MAVGVLLTSRKHNTALYDELVSLDYKLESYVTSIAGILGTDTSTLSTALSKEHETWLWNTLQTLQTTKVGDDFATKTLLSAMLQCVEDQIMQIETWMKILAGEVQAKQAEEFNTAKYFRSIFMTNPLVVIAMFLVIVLNLFGHLTQPGCNFALQVLQALVRCVLEQDGNFSPQHKSVINNCPTDIRTVHKTFQLDPDIIVYTTCPKCCCTHPPIAMKGSKVPCYLSQCQYIQYKGGKPYGAKLTKRKVQDKESIRVPIRPFT